MKNLNNYIIEKLRINSNTKLGLDGGIAGWFDYIKRIGGRVEQSSYNQGKNKLYIISPDESEETFDIFDDGSKYHVPCFILEMNKLTKSFDAEYYDDDEKSVIFFTGDVNKDVKIDVTEFDGIQYDRSVNTDDENELELSKKNADFIIDTLKKIHKGDL